MDTHHLALTVSIDPELKFKSAERGIVPVQSESMSL